MKSEEVIARLNEKLSSNLKCPMCGGNNFTLINGFFINAVQEKPNVFQFSNKSIPTVSIFFKNCGFVS